MRVDRRVEGEQTRLRNKTILMHLQAVTLVVVSRSITIKRKF